MSRTVEEIRAELRQLAADVRAALPDHDLSPMEVIGILDRCADCQCPCHEVSG